MTSGIVAAFTVVGAKSGKTYRIVQRQEFIQVNDGMSRQLVSTGFHEYSVESHSDYQTWPVYKPTVDPYPDILHFNVLDQKTGFQEECHFVKNSLPISCKPSSITIDESGSHLPKTGSY